MPLSVFPGSLDTFTNKTDGVDTILAAHINKCQDALAALQSNLGLTAKGSLADLSARLGVSLANDGTLNSGVIGTGQLAAGAVTTAKIANLAITQALLAAGAVGTAQIAGNAITAALIANNTITATQIANQTITATQIANATITGTQVAAGGILPDNLGLTVWNATGSSLTAGQLVYVSGWNVANGLAQVSLAVNNIANSAATYLVPATIANGASGTVRRHWTSAANLNTNAASGVGAAVYLDSTAGGWTLTAPAAAATRQQTVGRVVVKDAAVGQIEFDLISNPAGTVGSTDIQAGSISGTQLDGNRNVYRAQGFLGTIPTTGTVECSIHIPANGTLVGFKLISQDALAGSDTNYFTVSVVNKGTDGSGNTAMDVGTASDTTKVTGGSNGVVAYGSTNFGVNGGSITGNQVLKVLVTVTGTLPNTLRTCLVSATILLSP